MITYEVKELVKLLWSKKIYIFICGVIFTLLSLPLSNYSYESSLNNYNKLIAQDKLENNDKYKKEKSDNEAFVYVKTSLKHEQILFDIVQIIESQKLLGEKASQNKKNGDDFSIKILPSVNLFIIQEKNMEIDNFKIKIDEFLRETNLLMKELVPEEEIILSIIKETNTPIEKTITNKIILKPPTKQQSKIKVVTTASIVGIVFGCVLVLARKFYKDSN